MTQAVVSRTTWTCNSPCAGATHPHRRHGPHTYLALRDAAGKNTSLYAAPKHAAEALDGKVA